MPEYHPCVSHMLSPPGSFSKGVAEGEVDPSFGPLEAIRLSIQTDSPVWIILSEVNRAPSAPPIPALLTALIPSRSSFRFLSKKQSETGTRQKGHPRGSLVLLPPSRSLLPTRLARTRTAQGRLPGPALARRPRPSCCCCCCASPAGLRGQVRHRLLLKRSRKQNPTPWAEGRLCSAPSAPRGAAAARDTRTPDSLGSG